MVMSNVFGDIGNTIGGFFGDKSSQYGTAAQDYRNVANEYNPYIQRGTDAANFLMPQYQNLMTNPNFLQDQVSQGFYMSPYQQQMIKDTTNQMNINAANTGMIRSPVAQKALNDRLGTMTGQFMNDYINRGMQTYGMGMGGLSDMNRMGFDAQNQRANYLTGATQYNLGGDLSRQYAANNMIGTGMSMIGGLFSGGAGAAGAGTKTAGGFNMDF